MPFIFNRIRTRGLITLFMLLALSAASASAQTGNLQACIDKAANTISTMDCFRGIPYRADGVLDEHGRWTTWAKPEQTLTTPGLNCSGFTAAASRAIWNQTLSLDEMKRDRLHDSGSGASMGEDWDFGLDLILNLTDGLPRKLIPNPYENHDVESHLWRAQDLRGVDTGSNAYLAMLAQMQPNHLYYLAISKTDRRFAGRISFYHVGIIIKDGTSIWMYHATKKGGVYRVNLAGERGLAWFRHYYGASPSGPRYIQLVEVPVPANNN